MSKQPFGLGWKEAIVRLRITLGMTQEEFAREINVTVSTVNRWENCHSAPQQLARKAMRDLAYKHDFKGMPD